MSNSMLIELDTKMIKSCLAAKAHGFCEYWETWEEKQFT